MHRAAASLIAVLILTFATYGQSPTGRVDYTGHKLVRVTLRTQQDVQTMLAISSDNWSEGIGPGQVLFRVPPDRMDALRASGLPFEVVHDNIQALIDAEAAAQSAARGRAWFDAYHTYDEINAYIDTLVALRPDLVTKLNLGTSIEGRTIFGMRITSSVGGSNKPAVLYNGCQHAREWISPATVMYLADRLVRDYDTDPQVQRLGDDVIFYIVPIVNPDGYVYSWTTDRLWRKNRRNNGGGVYGVDLNRNWGAGWGLDSGSSSNPSSEVYRGTAPFSEPETQAVRDFVLTHPEIAAHIDFHSYSQLILYPYDYQAAYPPEPDRTTFVNLSADMANAIFSVHGQVYTDMSGWELYLASGTMPDWMYIDQGILAWTIELRPVGSPGFILPPDQIIPTGEENFAAILVLSDYVATQLEFTFPDGLPTVVPAETTSTVMVQINEISATLVPGSATVYTRVGNSGLFSSQPMTDLGSNLFEATLPAAPCGQTVEYYFEAQSSYGSLITSPDDAPTTVYQATAQQINVAFADDMESDNGWTVGAPGDTAYTGIWERVDPIGTAAQPEDDHTPSGTVCWVTGQGSPGGSLGENDVDGGATTLITPALDLTTLSDPTISYWRWYSNDTGNAPNQDIFVIDISDDDGATWVNVETVGPSGPETSGGWFYHEFRVADFVALTGTVRVRFIASDDGAGSIVEAAVDDFQVVDTGCPSVPCPGDLDGDNDIDLDDLTLLLGDFGCSSGCVGDIDGDGGTDLDDLTVLLQAFGTLCP